MALAVIVIVVIVVLDAEGRKKKVMFVLEFAVGGTGVKAEGQG